MDLTRETIYKLTVGAVIGGSVVYFLASRQNETPLHIHHHQPEPVHRDHPSDHYEDTYHA